VQVLRDSRETRETSQAVAAGSKVVLTPQQVRTKVGVRTKVEGSGLLFFFYFYYYWVRTKVGVRTKVEGSGLK
jgi:hypothetical protein